MVWCWLVPERITVISRTESQIAVSGRRLTGKERVAQMTTETRTTKVVTTETTTTIKSEQVYPRRDANRTESGREDLYGMLCECKWAIVATVFIVCVLFWLRPELAGLVVKLIGMANK